MASNPLGAVSTSYELSAGYVAGFGDALRKLGLYERVERVLSPQAVAALKNPSAQQWWSRDAVEEAGMKVLDAFGDEAVEQIGHEIAVGAVHGFFKIAMTLAGAKPEKMLAQVERLSAASVRGVTVRFLVTGPGAGRVEVTYPTHPPRSNGLLWKGALARTVEAMHIDGAKVVEMQQVLKTFAFPVRWTVR